MAKYSKKLVDKICGLIKTDSYTISEICRLVGIAESTFFDWQSTKVEFSECIKKAQEDRMQFFVVEAKKSLLKKIQGYTVDETKTVYVDSGKSKNGEKPQPRVKEQTIIKKHIQPDTAAVIFTLTNGEPETWRNRQSNEVTGKNGKDLFANTTDEELDERIKELERKNKL